MVTITNFHERTNSKGEQFYVLELSGGMEIKKNKSGMMYMTSSTCTIPTSFTATQCEHLIGQQIPGKIEKQPCKPYSYTVQSTGEVKELDYRYVFVDTTAEVIENNVVDESKVF